MRKGLAIPNRLFTEGVRPSEAIRILHTVKRINVLDDLCRAEHSAKLLKMCFLVKQKSINFSMTFSSRSVVDFHCGIYSRICQFNDLAITHVLVYRTLIP